MKILITGGPTWESIDSVRYISNRSSGKMGLAIAQAAVDAGHDTTLLLGPCAARAGIDPLKAQGIKLVEFESSADLKQLLETHWPDHDALVMAAAVADYRPSRVEPSKLPRQENQPLTVHMEPTPDLVAAVAKTKRPDQRIVAFALEESATLEQRALDKMRRKGVDAIVANALKTMDSDVIKPRWLTDGGQREALGEMTKPDFAKWLVARLSVLWPVSEI